MKAVLDSDVLIDFLQGDTRAAEEIERYDDLHYSVISWMEVMCGADTDAEKVAVKRLFDSMRAVELSTRVAHLAVEARRKHRLKLPDAVIWATADSEGCILVTRNAKDFDKDHPMIRIPY
jgi:predicted nucleic acid-binding protein